MLCSGTPVVGRLVIELTGCDQCWRNGRALCRRHGSNCRSMMMSCSCLAIEHGQTQVTPHNGNFTMPFNLIPFREHDDLMMDHMRSKLRLPNFLYADCNAFVPPPKFYQNFSQSCWVILTEYNQSVRSSPTTPTYLLEHMPNSRNDDHLELSLHLTDHKLFIQTIGTSRDKEARGAHS